MNPIFDSFCSIESEKARFKRDCALPPPIRSIREITGYLIKLQSSITSQRDGIREILVNWYLRKPMAKIGSSIR